jgi:hypothetical protein
MVFFQQKHIVIPGRAMRKHREGKGTQVEPPLRILKIKNCHRPLYAGDPISFYRKEK